MSGIPLIHWHSQWLEPIASRKINEKPTHIARTVREDALREALVAAALDLREHYAKRADEQGRDLSEMFLGHEFLAAITALEAS